MSNNLSKYCGVIPAFYACYDSRGAISPNSVQAFTRYLIEKGVKGLYVGGSSGECVYQTVSERKQMLEAVMSEVSGKITVIAHVACNSTKESCELAAHAESCGVDAIAAIPPIYYKLPEYAIAKYWNDISAAAPNTDFIIYNIPQLAGVQLTKSLFLEMRKNPRVIGVKNSSMPTCDIELFKYEGGPDCVVFNGPDEQFVSGLAIGADGGIGGTYPVMIELFLRMYDFMQQGKVKEAQKIQAEVNQVIYTMCSCKGSLHAAMKAVVKQRTGLDLGGVKEPFCSLVESDFAIVEKASQQIDRAIAEYC